MLERLGLKPRQGFQPIRVAVTGSKISPGLFESIELLGRETTLSGSAPRRFIGSGRGRASGSSARWNSSQARRRNCIVGSGSSVNLPRSAPRAHGAFLCPRVIIVNGKRDRPAPWVRRRIAAPVPHGEPALRARRRRRAVDPAALPGRTSSSRATRCSRPRRSPMPGAGCAEEAVDARPARHAHRHQRGESLLERARGARDPRRPRHRLGRARRPRGDRGADAVARQAVRDRGPRCDRPRARGRLARLGPCRRQPFAIAAEFESRLQRYLFERTEEARAVRVGEKEVSEQAAIVARYARPLHARAARRAARREERPTATSASGSTGCARPARGHHRRRARRAGGRARERDPRSARVAFRGEEMPLRARRQSSPCSTDYGDREELGELERGRCRRGSTTSGSTLLAAREELDAEISGDRRPGRAQRGGEGHLAPRARARARRCERTLDATRTGRLRETLVRPAARPRARRDAVERATCATCAASRRSSRRTRRSARRGLPATTLALGFDLDGDAEHPARPRGPAAEEPARLCDRVRSAGRSCT